MYLTRYPVFHSHCPPKCEEEEPSVFPTQKTSGPWSMFLFFLAKEESSASVVDFSKQIFCNQAPRHLRPFHCRNDVPIMCPPKCPNRKAKPKKRRSPIFSSQPRRSAAGATTGSAKARFGAPKAAPAAAACEGGSQDGAGEERCKRTYSLPFQYIENGSRAVFSSIIHNGCLGKSIKSMVVG